MVAADARTAVTFSLSPGQAHDARRQAPSAKPGADKPGRFIYSWIAPMRGTRRASWRWTWGSFRLFPDTNPP